MTAAFLTIKALALVFCFYKKFIEILCHKVLLYFWELNSVWTSASWIILEITQLKSKFYHKFFIILLYWNVSWFPMMGVLACCKLWTQFLQLYICVWWSLTRRHWQFEMKLVQIELCCKYKIHTWFSNTYHKNNVKYLIIFYWL